MFNLRKNYQRNTLIIPNENYFIERAEKNGDKKVKNWTIAVCAAADQFFEFLFFEIKDKNNLFYTQRHQLKQNIVQQLFKTLAIFYLYFYCKKGGCDDDFRKNIYNVFEIAELEAEKYILHYKMMDDGRDKIDYPSLKLEEHFKKQKVSITTMMHFYGLLLEKGFGEDAGKRHGDLVLLVKVTEIAILNFNLFIKNKV